MIKTNGAEFKRFYTDDAFWPDSDGSTWHEDELVTVDGKCYEQDYSNVPDSAVVTIADGIVFSHKWDSESAPSFETYFKRWRKLQTTETFTVEAPKDKLDAIKAAIKAAGGKVV